METEEEIVALISEKNKLIDSWSATKKILNERWTRNQSVQKSRTFIRGDIYWCELGENIGTEENKKRLVMIISHRLINTHSDDLLVVPLSRSLKIRKNKDGSVILNSKGNVLPRLGSHLFLFNKDYNFVDDCALMFEYTRVVSRVRLSDKRGNIPETDPIFKEIKKRIEFTFGI